MGESSFFGDKELSYSAEETRERVDKLKDTDGPKEDSIHDLAEKEDSHRKHFSQNLRRVLKKDSLWKKLIGRDGFSEEEKALIEREANVYSNQVLRAVEAEKASLVDPLTELRNRRSFLQEGAKLLNFEKRSGNNCSVLMIDLDDFKKINDSFGHPVGDEVLKVVSNVLRSTVRDYDIVGRYGGEEFSVVLADTDEGKARQIAEEMRKRIESKEIFVMDQKVTGRKATLRMVFTASIGVASTSQLEAWKKFTPGPQGGRDLLAIFEELVGKADQALYRAKREGKNRVEIFSEDKKLDDEAGQV